MKRKEIYTVTEDADIMAPAWLAVRVDGRNIKFLYRVVDGAQKLKGVKVGEKIAEIGDKILYNGKRLAVEKGSRRPVSNCAGAK